MTRHHSSVMKRRAAMAAILALATFMTCVTMLWVADRAGSLAQPHALAAKLVEPYLVDLGEAKSAAERQKIVESLVRQSGEIAAAVVVNPDLTIEAAYPGRMDLVGKSVDDKSDEPTQGGGEDAAMSGGTGQESAPPEGSVTAPAMSPPNSSEVPATAEPAAPMGKGGIRRKGGWERAAPPRRGRKSGGHPENYIAGRVQGLMVDAPSIGHPATTIGPIQERLLTSKGDLAGWLLALPRWPYDRHEFLHSAEPVFGLGAFFSFVLYSLMLPWWVYLDARPRTTKAAPLALFVLLTNFLGWLTYLVIRPESDRLCPGCDTPLDPGYRLCPMCGWSGTSRCHQCGRPARPDWRFCPYCEAARPDVELAGGLTRPIDPGKGWS